MASETVDPTRDADGRERHPAWGLIGAVRSHGTPRALFDSDIRHSGTVRVRLYGAVRERDLHRDHVHVDSRAPFVEVEMSEAQWASFVSSMGAGDGVPCTIRARTSENGFERMPDVPYEPRLQESMDEVRDAAGRAQRKVQEAFEAYDAHRTAANRRNLKYAIENMPANMAFAARSLSEHAENVVQRARADVEAMVLSKARQLGLDPGELGVTAPQLTEGDHE